MSTNASPFFSIVTVVLNDLAGLKSTQASLGRQNCTDYEWIVIDGGSTSAVTSYLASLGHLPLSWLSEKDRGTYDGMNKGTARARGQYINYMNAGDTFSRPDSLNQAKRALIAAGQPELLFGGGCYKFADGHLRYRSPRRMDIAIRHGLPGMHQATFYRRDFLDVPPYDLSYPVSADYFISARCFLRGARVCYVDISMADFEVGGRSMQKMHVSIHDCWRIQRKVLGLSRAVRIFSAARRWISYQILRSMHGIMHRRRAGVEHKDTDVHFSDDN